MRRVVLWGLLAEFVPLYPLYSLLFRDSGVSAGAVSTLFAIWSAVGLVAEVPAGALADRFSRRGALVAAGVLQAGGYAVWVGLPSFPSFACGFVLWGLGGALGSGALEALLYDGLAAAGAADTFGRVYGWVTAAGLVAQLPAAGAAALLFGAGGYAAVGWASVGTCLAGSLVAARLPEAPRTGGSDDGPGLLDTLRTGLRDVAAGPGLRAALLVVALLTGLDAFEEYVDLLAADWGVPTGLVPLAALVVPAAGGLGALLGGRAGRLRSGTLAALLGSAALLLGVAGAVGRPAALLVLAAFYGAYRLVLVVAGARLQEQIEGTARATVTSLAALGAELGAFTVYAAWAAGRTAACAALVLLVALVLPRGLRSAPR